MYIMCISQVFLGHILEKIYLGHVFEKDILGHNTPEKGILIIFFLNYTIQKKHTQNKILKENRGSN